MRNVTSYIPSVGKIKSHEAPLKACLRAAGILQVEEVPVVRLPRLPYEKRLWLQAIPMTRAEAAHAIGCSLHRLGQHLNEGRELPPGAAKRFDELVMQTSAALVEQGCVCETCHYRTRPYPGAGHVIECERQTLVWSGVIGCWRWRKRVKRRRPIVQWLSGPAYLKEDSDD